MGIYNPNPQQEQQTSTQPRKVNVFIGYDERQDLAYRVCKHSIENHLWQSDNPVKIYPLKHRELRKIGLFNREWKMDRNGLVIDALDGRPFSTNFAFTRFLVPTYAEYLGILPDEPCVFVDSDFVFTRSIFDIFTEIKYTDKPLWVVKHNYLSPYMVKMDGQHQENYNMKLWSSLMVFNRLAPSEHLPTVKQVNEETGNWLHTFKWLPDDKRNYLLGSLFEGWNFIPNHSDARVMYNHIRAVHYTEGVPLLKPDCKYAELFNDNLSNFLRIASRDPIKAFS